MFEAEPPGLTFLREPTRSTARLNAGSSRVAERRLAAVRQVEPGHAHVAQALDFINKIEIECADAVDVDHGFLISLAFLYAKPEKDEATSRRTEDRGRGRQEG